MESVILVSLIACLGSLLTFFSGFGLGTILLPVMALFFPLPAAVVATAIVHLSNNIFKFALLKKDINFSVVIKFGIPSAIAAFIGSLLLLKVQHLETLYSYTLLGREFHITFLNMGMGLLIFFFSILEAFPLLNKINFSKINLWVGGLISGFFGGFSGHQGALRSAFLIRFNLSKEQFLASGMAIALLVDLTRIPTYFANFRMESFSKDYYLLIAGVVSALVGALVGNLFLKKITFSKLKAFVSLFLCLLSLLMCAGILNKN